MCFVLKSFGPWAVGICNTRRHTMYNQKIKTHTFMIWSLGDVFSSLISWSYRRLCNPYIRAGYKLPMSAFVSSQYCSPIPISHCMYHVNSAPPYQSLTVPSQYCSSITLSLYHLNTAPPYLSHCIISILLPHTNLSLYHLNTAPL